MALDKKRALQIQENAGNTRVEGKASKLRGQWSFASGRNCLHHDWISLARSVGLSEADVPALKRWVAAQGLKEPKRVIAKGKGNL